MNLVGAWGWQFDFIYDERFAVFDVYGCSAFHVLSPSVILLAVVYVRLIYL